MFVPVSVILGGREVNVSTENVVRAVKIFGGGREREGGWCNLILLRRLLITPASYGSPDLPPFEKYHFLSLRTTKSHYKTDFTIAPLHEHLVIIIIEMKLHA